MNLSLVIYYFGIRLSFAQQCINYDSSYNTINGTDITLNISASIKYVDIGANATMIESATPVEFIAQDWGICNNSDGCIYRCIHDVTCAESIIRCNSSRGCNLYCTENNACEDMIISSYPGTSLTIICSSRQSCKGLRLDAIGSSRIDIYCLSQQSCVEMEIYLNDISSQQNPNTSIICWFRNACDDLIIDSDGPYTKLKMYQYSSNIKYYNPIGYLSDLQTVSCGLSGTFIKFDLDNIATQQSLSTLTQNEYSASLLPCQGVTIICAEGNETVNANTSCNMEYKYLTQRLNNNDKLDGIDCVYIELIDIVFMDCPGQCITSPTNPPTLTPTQLPSNAPSYSPSMTPTYPPSLSPTLNPTIPPTNNPTGYPTYPPTFSPTNAPTMSPTNSPTRSPITGTPKWDMKLDLVYIFAYCNEKNYDFILSNSDSIDIIEAEIEREYFKKDVLPYTVFDVQIIRLNGIHPAQLVPNQIKNKEKLFLLSQVFFKKDYERQILTKSQSDTWYKEVTKSFQKYFDNPRFNFSVANASSLEARLISDQPSAEFDLVFIIVTAVVLSCIMIPIIISRCSKIYQQRGCLPTDSVNYYALSLIGFATFDVVTNIILIYHTFHPRHKGSIIANCGQIMLIFIILRILSNIYYVTYKIPKVIVYNIFANNWWRKYKKTFLFWVILTGGNCYPMLMMASSNLFGMRFTNSGLSKLELKPIYLHNKGVIIGLLLIEALPIFIVQIVILTIVESVTSSLISAFTSTSIFVLLYLIYFWMNCTERERDKRLLIFYYIEVKLKSQIAVMTSLRRPEQKHIKQRKGIRKEFKKYYIGLYPENNNMKKNFEVGDVDIRRKGFVIRFIYRLNKFDLLTDNDNEYNVNADSENIEAELKDYCLNQFISQKEAIKELIMAHYYDLDAHKFEIKYHKNYVMERKAKVNALNLGTISNDLDEGESDEGENENENENENEVGIIQRQMTREQIEQEMLDQHRSQFKAAIQIIKQEKSAGRTDYNHLVFVLQSNDIGYAAIDDVLKYAKKSGFIGDGKGCMSDIDNSDTSDNEQAFGEQFGEYVGGEIEMNHITKK